MNESGQGFSPKNLERIYMGKPVLVNGKLPANVLSDVQYETANLVADGYSNEEAATELGVSPNSVGSRVNRTCGRLGISSSIGLAMFFPLGPDHPLLEGKRLQDLNRGSLEVVDSLSKGVDRKHIAKIMNTTPCSINNKLNYAARKKWPDCERPMNIVRTANAIRAKYAREFEKNNIPIKRLLGGFALHSLVEQEPRIIKLFDL